MATPSALTSRVAALVHDRGHFGCCHPAALGFGDQRFWGRARAQLQTTSRSVLPDAGLYDAFADRSALWLAAAGLAVARPCSAEQCRQRFRRAGKLKSTDGGRQTEIYRRAHQMCNGLIWFIGLNRGLLFSRKEFQDRGRGLHRAAEHAGTENQSWSS